MADYITVENESSDFFVEKKSRFIGYAAPVQTAQQAIDFINEIKKKHSDARHNVYAYSIRQNNISRYSDDGEPQGTGGLPVLEVINKQNICDVCVVVTRYFGGVLLGTGGLTRAYQQGCKIALAAAHPIVMAECVCFDIECDYNQYNILQSMFMKMGVNTEKSEFLQSVKLQCYVKKSLHQSAFSEIRERFSGQVVPKLKENKYFSFNV